MNDIAPKWNHPKLNKTISELLNCCEDTSAIKEVGNIQNPTHQLALKQLNYIAIEGNIGSGKTSLAKRIGDDYNAKLSLRRSHSIIQDVFDKIKAPGSKPTIQWINDIKPTDKDNSDNHQYQYKAP